MGKRCKSAFFTHVQMYVERSRQKKRQHKIIDPVPSPRLRKKKAEEEIPISEREKIRLPPFFIAFSSGKPRIRQNNKAGRNSENDTGSHFAAWHIQNIIFLVYFFGEGSFFAKAEIFATLQNVCMYC